MSEPTFPDAAMMRPIVSIARFMTTGDATCLEGAFADDVTILENFAPYIFAGPGSVDRWAKLFRAHVKNLRDLEHRFGEPQDVHLERDLAYFALPTTWRGKTPASPFVETGGWSFVLVRKDAGWRVKAYAWAVTSYKKM